LTAHDQFLGKLADRLIGNLVNRSQVLSGMLVTEMKLPVLPLLDNVSDVEGSRLGAFLGISWGVSVGDCNFADRRHFRCHHCRSGRSRRNERCPRLPIEA